MSLSDRHLAKRVVLPGETRMSYAVLNEIERQLIAFESFVDRYRSFNLHRFHYRCKCFLKVYAVSLFVTLMDVSCLAVGWPVKSVSFELQNEVPI